MYGLQIMLCSLTPLGEELSFPEYIYIIYFVLDIKKDKNNVFWIELDQYDHFN